MDVLRREGGRERRYAHAAELCASAKWQNLPMHLSMFLPAILTIQNTQKGTCNLLTGISNSLKTVKTQIFTHFNNELLIHVEKPSTDLSFSLIIWHDSHFCVSTFILRSKHFNICHSYRWSIYKIKLESAYN